MNSKEIALVIAACILIAVGWTTRGWFEDSKDLAAAQAIEKSREVMRELAGEVATKTEQAIGGIRVENRTIYQSAVREIVEKPVYRNCVLPDDGLRAANEARRGPATGQSLDPLRAPEPTP